MKIVIQRVSSAFVEVDGKRIGSIGLGALVFLAVTHQDTENEARWLASKLATLRMFPQDHKEMEGSLLDLRLQVLIVSQFTLYAQCDQGRRPSFTLAAKPDHAKHLYQEFIQEVQRLGLNVQTGLFGADMQVSLTNQGPATFIIEKNPA